MGLSSAKALAAARRLPLVPVDHLHGHVVASTLGAEPIEPPYLCLVASGGHTFLARVDDPAHYTVLGQTLDDAAGEAFDKGARLLGLGYPGGPRSTGSRATAIPTPSTSRAAPPGSSTSASAGSRPRCSTACATSPGRPRRPGRLLPARDRRRAGGRTRTALEREGLERLAIGGGVAANSELRAAVAGSASQVLVPPVELCTDNAAMIAGAARFLEPLPYPDYLALDAAARLGLGEQAPSRDSSRSRSRSTLRRTSSLISCALRSAISASRWASKSSYISRR